MPIVKTSAKGQVVIPSAFRKKIGLKAGARILVTMGDGDTIILRAVPDDPIRALRGLLKGGRSLTKALLAERRKDREYEAKKLARFLRHSRLDPGRTGRPGRRRSAARG